MLQSSNFVYTIRTTKYYCKQNQGAEIYFCLLFLFFIFSISQPNVQYRQNSTQPNQPSVILQSAISSHCRSKQSPNIVRSFSSDHYRSFQDKSINSFGDLSNHTNHSNRSFQSFQSIKSLSDRSNRSNNSSVVPGFYEYMFGTRFLKVDLYIQQ